MKKPLLKILKPFLIITTALKRFMKKLKNLNETEKTFLGNLHFCKNYVTFLLTLFKNIEVCLRSRDLIINLIKTDILSIMN